MEPQAAPASSHDDGVSAASEKKAEAAPQVTLQGRRALSRSKGIVRVPLEDLGPALFNRGGAPTSGRHCMNLAKRIFKIEGFATYRYIAGYCHEPDPANPLAVSRHGNGMADRDALLPRLGAKALKGVFAKTHLVTLLQLYKQGQMPELVAFVETNRTAEEREELNDALTYGLYMHVFPWSAVAEHADDMKALMASDNFDHGHGLTDCELRCIKGMREAILKLPVPPASSQYATVMQHVERMSGQRWHEKDLQAFWNYAQTTLDMHLDLLLEIWVFGECEDMLQVDSAFFDGLSRVSARAQWCRCALAVKHFLSDRATECTLVGGRYVAGGVDKNAMKKMSASSRNDKQKASSQAMEEFMDSMMQKYYVPWSADWMKSPFQREAWAKAFAAFLCKMGTYICRDSMPDQASKLKLETKMRLTLEQNRLEDLPPRVLPLSNPSASSHEGLVELQTLQAASVGETSAAVPLKRMAAEAGILVSSAVVLKKAKGGSEADGVENSTSHGLVTAIENGKISVDWDLGGSSSHDLGDLTPAPKAKASSQEAQAVPPSIPWMSCSDEDNTRMASELTLATLYQVYVAQSAGHLDLHITASPAAALSQDGPLQLWAARDFKPRTLVLLPFSTTIIEAGRAGGKDIVPLLLQAYPVKENRTTMRFWLKMKSIKKDVGADPRRVPSLVPYWILASKARAPQSSGSPGLEPRQEDKQGVAMLSNIVLAVNVPCPAAVAKGVKVQKAKIILRVPAFTNMGHVGKGARLMVDQKPRTELQSDEEEIPEAE